MIKNEEEFIELITKNFERIKDIPKNWIGVGDDAAKIISSDKSLIFCTDAMVENVHFKTHDDYNDVGWKSIVSNQSDLAAMGAYPVAFCITIGINKRLNQNKIKKLYEGMNSACKEFGGYLVGGDIVKSETSFISISAIGTLYNTKRIMVRDNAKIGDLVAHTGNIGDSGAGLFKLENNLSKKNDSQIKKFLRPIPRIKEAQMAIEIGVECCIDLSDGLEKDLMRICNASHVEIIINFEKIRTSKELHNLYENNLFQDKVLSSGEDYELILIGDEKKINSLKKKIDLNIIGKVINNKKSDLKFFNNSSEINKKSNNYDHFKN
jgi:thiamine-monophosphate kinase|tara:strand:+ start:2266 stop:3231 length:966 start_codon:yes stop_codon:yes gene_type:complete